MLDLFGGSSTIWFVFS